jgi:hypothetical protein
MCRGLCGSEWTCSACIVSGLVLLASASDLEVNKDICCTMLEKMWSGIV